MTQSVAVKAREQNKPWCWVWFHGKMEDVIAANSDEQQVDLVGSDFPKPTKPGIFHVDVYGVRGVCYMWNDGHNMLTGLIVDPTDLEGHLHAISQYQSGAVN